MIAMANGDLVADFDEVCRFGRPPVEQDKARVTKRLR